MKFIKRSEPDHTMVSVRLSRLEGKAQGEVFLPMRQRGEALTTASTPDAGALTATEALGLATAHAFDMRTDIAVIDETGIWRREWGTLHAQGRPAAPGAAEGESAPVTTEDSDGGDTADALSASAVPPSKAAVNTSRT